MSDNPYIRRTVLKQQIASNHLGCERTLRIFLPPGYDERVSYPVVYCQDGEEFFNFGRIATQAMKLILDEGLEPFLIVGVDVDMPRRTAEYHPEGDRFASYMRFFIEEMIPFVESRYPVQQGKRIVAGDSLGGTVSLHLSLEVPVLIQKVISLSGAFFESSFKAVKAKGILNGLKVYQVIGTEETAVQTSRGSYDFLALNRQMKKTLEHQGANVQYVEKPGRHVWGFWQNELPEALRWILS